MRTAAIVLVLLGVTGLGLYGVTSFSVTQRTKQIGTRRALGASRGDIVRLFLLESALISALGIGLGAILALGLNNFLVLHFDGARLSPLLGLGGGVILFALGMVAAVTPALRGAQVAPALATRTV